MEFSILTLCYLIGSVTFIIGLKMLSNPATARKGNLIAAAGMTIAIFGTIFLYRDEESGERLHNYGWIFLGLAIGGIVGTLAAKKVKMTAMPEMVSLFNGMGGACAALISLIEFGHYAHSDFRNIIHEAYEAGTQVDETVLELGVPVFKSKVTVMNMSDTLKQMANVVIKQRLEQGNETAEAENP